MELQYKGNRQVAIRILLKGDVQGKTFRECANLEKLMAKYEIEINAGRL